MQLAVAGSAPAYLPYKFREAQSEIDDLAADITGSHGDGRLDLIRHHAETMYGYVIRRLAETEEIADVLHCATVACGAVRDFGQDRVQAAIVAGALEAEREKRREIGRGMRYESRCLADVIATPIKWLWFSRMGRGKINMLVGNPGVSKSTFSIALAAAVTIGGKLPDGTMAPKGSVIFVTCEDDAADTIVPRLKAAGADLDRVHILDWVLDPKDSARRQHFDVGVHREALQELIAAIGDVVLIIIDPITAYCGLADSHKTADVRQALAPLQEVAASTNVAILAISHLNKNSGEGTALNRVVGSGAFVAVARSAWLIAEDPSDESRRRRILTPLKNNLGDDRTGFAFTVEGVELDGGIKSSRVLFEAQPVTVSAEELLSRQAETAEDRGVRSEAEEFLRELLATGPLMTKTVEQKAREAGISSISLKRARARLGVKAKKSEGTGAWVLSLPPQQGDQGDHLDQEFGDRRNDPLGAPQARPAEAPLAMGAAS
jgi:putative DNA primase/helicase